MRKLAQENQKKVRLISSVITSLWTVLVGVLFIVQVWRIFSLGAKSFTPVVIGKHFSQISLFVWLWFAFAIANAVVHAIYPASIKKAKASVCESAIIRRLKTRLPDGKISVEDAKQEKNRIIVKVFCALLLAVCFIVALSVLLSTAYKPRLQKGFFLSHPEAERLIFAMPWLVLSALSACGYKYYCVYSKKRQIIALKTAFAKPETTVDKPQGKTIIEKAQSVFCKTKNFFSFIKKEKTVFIIRVMLAVLAVAFIVWGIVNGGMADVLEKAVNICTQCIGLG